MTETHTRKHTQPSLKRDSSGFVEPNEERGTRLSSVWVGTSHHKATFPLLLLLYRTGVASMSQEWNVYSKTGGQLISR